MLIRGVCYLAAFVVASVAVVGHAVFHQLSFPIACGMMVLFTVLLAIASDVSDSDMIQNSRSQIPAALSNHLHTPSLTTGSSYERDIQNSNDSNNSNCVRAHSDVELSTFGSSSTAARSARTTAIGRTDPATVSDSLLPSTPEAGHVNRVQLAGRVPLYNELRRPSLRNRHNLAISDNVKTPARTFTTPSGSGLWPDSSKSHQHILPQFQRLSTRSVFTLNQLQYWNLYGSLRKRARETLDGALSTYCSTNSNSNPIPEI